MNIKKLINQVITDLNNDFPNFDGTGDIDGQKRYLDIMKNHIILP